MKDKDLINILTKIGRIAEERMEDTVDAEQRAFLFGHLNIAAVLFKTHIKNTNEVNICLDYKNALEAYENAKDKFEQKEVNDELPGQISIEDLLKEFKELKKLLFGTSKSETSKRKATKKD